MVGRVAKRHRLATFTGLVKVCVFVDESWPGARTGGVAEMLMHADRHGYSDRRIAGPVRGALQIEKRAHVGKRCSSTSHEERGKTAVVHFLYSAVQILGDYPGDVPRGGDVRGIT